MKNIGGALVPEAMPQFSVSNWFYTHTVVLNNDRVLLISILYILHSKNISPREITESD